MVLIPLLLSNVFPVASPYINFIVDKSFISEPMLLSFISDDLYITSPSIFSVADGYVLVKYCFAVSPVLSLFPLLYAINSSDTSVAVIFPSPFKSPITDIAISIF